jgi:glycosyltransferase involved in cell wall biosynthesis
MTAMIRVVLCAHNGVRFIEAQLASIMEQSHPVDIVHAFDFASSDGTQALLERLAVRWPKLDVRLVDHAPGVTLSFSHAFAQIVPICGDDDIVFLSDQDDIWLPVKAERMIACVEQARRDGNDRVLAFHDVQVCDVALRPIRQSFYEGRPFRLPRDLDPERLLVANPIIGHTIVTTKSLLDLMLRCQRLSRYVMHDWAMVLLAAHTGQIVSQGDRLGLYRQHEANVLGAARRRSVGNYIRRAVRLSRSVNIQTAAFIEDLRCAARAAGVAPLPSPLPGSGPLAWRLGHTMARHGPTVWHRLFGLMQAQHLFLHDGDRTDR